MCKNILLLFLLIQTLLVGQETGQQWTQRKLEDLRAAEEGPIEAAWDKLKPVFLSLGYRYPSSSHPDEAMVFEEAQRIMMAKPGYAHWVRSEIDRRWELVLQERAFKRKHPGRPMPVEAEFYQAEYRYQIEGDRLIQSLGFLPCQETVEVLGELLSDERHGFQRGRGLSKPYDAYPSNALQAARALKQLRVGPIDDAENLGLAMNANYAHVDTYLDWWGQVKAGNREYEFGWEGWKYYKGKYMIRSKEELQELSESGTLRQKTLKPRQPTPEPAKSPRNWPVLSALALVVLAVFLALLNRRPQSEPR